MEELSIFFSDEISSSRVKTPLPPKIQNWRNNRIKKSGSGLASKARVFDKFGVLRNASEPEISNQDSFGLYKPDMRTSYSFSEPSHLPLSLPPEVEEGNIEYKLKLVNPSPNRFEHLVTQMKWRLNEGGGQAIYRLGVDDNGAVTGLTHSEMTASLNTVFRMARRLSANLLVLRECTVTIDQGNQVGRKAVELLVQQHLPINPGLPDLCITVLGSVDVGKSTLIGILTDGELDNGRGRARLNLFRHLHEVQTGRTSSLSSEVIGFDAAGHLINRQRSKGRLSRRTVDEVVRDSNRLITLFDLAGHPKYQRITLSGLARGHASFAILVVSATSGLTQEGIDHARTAIALALPLAIVVSKVDVLAPSVVSPMPLASDSPNPPLTISTSDDNSLRKYSLKSSLTLVLPNEKVSRKISTGTPFSQTSSKSISNQSHAITVVKKTILERLKSIRICSLQNSGGLLEVKCFIEDPPIFPLSSVSGVGLNDLLVFLARVSKADFSRPNLEGLLLAPRGLPSAPAFSMRNSTVDMRSPGLVEFWVTKIFWQVPGVKYPVLGGILKSGEIHEKQRLLFGPDDLGKMRHISVIEIRRNRQPHRMLFCGQMGSLVLAPLIHDGSITTDAYRNTSDCPMHSEPTSRTDEPLDLAWVRRGMVLLNQSPLPMVTSPGEVASAVCWSFSVSRLIWLPCSGVGNKVVCNLPSAHTNVSVYSGAVCQRAEIVENLIDSGRWNNLVQCASQTETALFRLDSDGRLILRFVRRPEYLVYGRQVILAFDSGVRVVGFVVALLDVLVSFAPEEPSFLVPGADAAISVMPERTSQNNTILSWQSFTPESGCIQPATSFDDLLLKVGVNALDIDEAVHLNDNSEMLTRRERIQNNKRRRKTMRLELPLSPPEQSHVVENEQSPIDCLETTTSGSFETLHTAPSLPSSSPAPSTNLIQLAMQLDGCRCLASDGPERSTDPNNCSPNALVAPFTVDTFPKPSDTAKRKRTRRHRRRRKHRH